MTILLDSHVLAWYIADDRRLSRPARDRIGENGVDLAISAITAYEFADLHHRGRFAHVASLDVVIDVLSLDVLPLPVDLWRSAMLLPALHRDPVDRMLVAHAIHADFMLITGDATMRAYPVRTIW